MAGKFTLVGTKNPTAPFGFTANGAAIASYQNAISQGTSTNLSASDYGLLSQFGITDQGVVNGHQGYGDLENYLNSLTGQQDATIKQMQAGQGAPGFNQQAYDSAVATRSALNKLRINYVLQNQGNSGDLSYYQGGQNPVVQQVETLLNSKDPATQAAIQASGGIPDVSVLGDPAAAAQFLKTIKDQITATQTKATSDAAAAATAAQNASDTAKLTATTQDQFAAADNDYQAALTTAGTTFDATTAAQQAGRQSDTAQLAHGLGFGASVTAAGSAEGLADSQATADRAATMNDARQTAASTLASAYENALSTNVAGTSLSAEQQAQVHGQAADQLAATIQQEYASLSVEQQSQLSNVQNLLSQYQNSTLSDEQKQSLLGKIIQGILGAGGTVAGALIGGPGGALAGGAAGSAAGSAIGAAA